MNRGVVELQALILPASALVLVPDGDLARRDVEFVCQLEFSVRFESVVAVETLLQKPYLLLCQPLLLVALRRTVLHIHTDGCVNVFNYRDFVTNVV